MSDNGWRRKFYWKIFALWEKAKFFMEDVWKQPRFGYALITAAFATFIWWCFHVPPPGYSVTIMGVAAGLMTARKMRPTEKTFWVIILFAFAVLEFKAIRHDRSEAETTRARAEKSENEHFQGIADGLKNSINLAQHSFDITAANLTSLSNLSKENLDAVTGGRSFLYFEAVENPNARPSLDCIVKGRYPMRNVLADMYLTDTGKFDHDVINIPTIDVERSFTLNDLSPGSHPIQARLMHGTVYTFSIWSLTGKWEEQLDLRNNHQKITLTKDGKAVFSKQF